MTDTEVGLAAPGNLDEAPEETNETVAAEKPKRRRRTVKEPQPTAAAAAKAKVFHRYQAKRSPIHHPYQKKLVPVSGWVELVPDSWVEVQLAAKVITDLGPA